VARSKASLRLNILQDIGWQFGLFNKSAGKYRGRKPKNYPLLDLKNPSDLLSAILLSLSEGE
jgi:hypothetical protein